jgi:hypothetical protein
LPAKAEYAGGTQGNPEQQKGYAGQFTPETYQGVRSGERQQQGDEFRDQHGGEGHGGRAEIRKIGVLAGSPGLFWRWLIHGLRA